jgi:hypothetical protein
MGLNFSLLLVLQTVIVHVPTRRRDVHRAVVLQVPLVAHRLLEQHGLLPQQVRQITVVVHVLLLGRFVHGVLSEL